MTASRRAWLVDQVDRHDHDVYARLRQASADLREQRKELDAQRAAQADAVADLQKQANAADGKLAVAQRAAAEEAAQQARTATVAAATTAGLTADVSPAGSSTTGPGPTTTPSPTQTTAAASKPVAPPYTGTEGTNPHHDDPVLTCIRQRESGGNYSAVSRDGYLGAYQFAQSTWNIAAGMAGRSDLVGVTVNTATPYDQDDVAWALLQAQGLGPWGGHCP
jgi:hypothetical protein